MSNENMSSGSILLSQRNLANTKFIERFVSGSLRLIGTDANGVVTTYNVLDFSGSGASLVTGSTYPITSSWANNVAGGLSSSFNYVSASTIYGQTASFSSLLLNTTATVPTTTSDPGTTGEVRIDANFMYIYSGGAWKRMILSTW